MIINPVSNIKGKLRVPGDKSISHRAIMLGSIARGTTIVNGFLMGDDCLSTINCFKQMNIKIEITNKKILVHGNGLYGLSKPNSILDVGNSGTTMRLMSGILCGQNFESFITGDDSIKTRPMDRIIKPLTNMNSNIISVNNNGKAPLHIKPSILKNINYNSPVASAQVKSSIMLASLYTSNITTINEPYTSRNHSEIMLNEFGANIKTSNTKIICNPIDELYSTDIVVPSDISSAAYFIVATLITPNSELILKDVGINPTRNGLIEILRNMNGNIELDNVHYINGEKIADIIVKSSSLTGTTIEKSVIPRLIDEIPILAVAGAYAEGKTVIKDASELKVKESNRIDTIVTELRKMNVDIISTDDGMIITGGNTLNGAIVESYNDHRVAMSLAIAGLNATSSTTINNSNCIKISYPSFFEDIRDLV